MWRKNVRGFMQQSERIATTHNGTVLSFLGVFPFKRIVKGKSTWIKDTFFNLCSVIQWGQIFRAQRVLRHFGKACTQWIWCPDVADRCNKYVKIPWDCPLKIQNIHMSYKRRKLHVPDRRRRIIPEVVLVRRWAVGVLGIWKGEGWVKGWDRGGQFTSNLRPRWTDPVTARRVPSK